jgi:hypothetical protein
MNFRLLCCIAMGVFTTHLGVIMLIAQFRPKPHLVAPPKPNFTSKSTVVVDRATGEKTIYREITVSTKFVPTPATPAPVPPQISSPAPTIE